MKPLPRDFIETAEGLVFAVVGLAGEDERIPAFLRYVPDPRKGHRKVGTDEANAFLRKYYPQYLHHCGHRDAWLHGVPKTHVSTCHRPRERLRHLLQRAPQDDLETRLQKLLKLLTGHGVDLGHLGVTGSMLIGRQHAESDVDLVVYDRATFFRVRRAVRQLIDSGQLHELDDSAWCDAYARRGCELSLEEFLRHEKRKGNKGMVDGRKFDIALVADTDSLEPEAGWRKAGMRRIRARIVDDDRAFDQPARYGLDHPEVSEIYSFTHTYTGQACAGEWVEANGQLEIAPDGRQRLIVGSSREAPGEYVRVIWEDEQAIVGNFYRNVT